VLAAIVNGAERVEDWPWLFDHIGCGHQCEGESAKNRSEEQNPPDDRDTPPGRRSNIGAVVIDEQCHRDPFCLLFATGAEQPDAVNSIRAPRVVCSR